jgi:hypothetical protein
MNFSTAIDRCELPEFVLSLPNSFRVNDMKIEPLTFLMPPAN